MRVEFSSEAEREVEEAFDWYLERNPAAAADFFRELGRCVERVSVQPALFPIFEAGTRRAILRRFPYSLIFLVLETRLYIVAVAHHARRPRYWRQRLKALEP